MKFAEGEMKRAFEKVAPDYPDIESWHVIVDNAAHQLVKRPEQFEVLVMTNMNGDILSDLTSALIGGLGFAPSANIGNDVAIFEAVHGSAPKYAGKDVINPTAMILSGVLMLRSLGLFEQAEAIEHAVFVTLESGVLTGDVVGYDKGTSTTDYTDAIIGNLGKRTERWAVRETTPIELPKLDPAPDYVRPRTRAVVGLDVFVESPLTAAELGASLMELSHDTTLSLKMISSRGTKVFPPTGATGTCTPCSNGSRPDTPGCTSRSCRSSTGSSASRATRARTERYGAVVTTGSSGGGSWGVVPSAGTIQTVTASSTYAGSVPKTSWISAMISGGTGFSATTVLTWRVSMK
jgi:Isocitrate/isopropylmalate dehydrogenase/Bacterial isocitrate dehydrogenase, C-terminal domain